MNEGRKTQIILLDERRLDILVQPKLYTFELLDLVASHFKLQEKHYFGLAFLDETSHFNWLHGEKKVLDHDFPRKSGVLQLHFSVRFYVDTIGILPDSQTVELFYLNARQAVFRGQIECDSETVLELAAHVLQACKGDFTSDEETREHLKRLPVIPTRTLKEHPSISYCEEKVIGYYKKLLGTSRGLAIVNYMTIVERLPTYGIHYYEVKDKREIPWWLGISPKGIAVYDKNDKTTPRRLFTWKHLENLYYRDKKFSIEVHDPKRDGGSIVHTLSSFNLYEDAIREPVEQYDDLSDAITDPTTQVSVSRRTFGTSSVNVHAWLASSPQLTRCIWSMAVAQHKFYLDRKQSKSSLTAARSMSEIAADLSRSSTSLVDSDLSRSASSQSLPSLGGSRFDLNMENLESQKAEREMFKALKARKEALEEALRSKLEELKLLCFQEGELTGELPKETPLEAGERVPTFRRRIGTSFALSPKTIHKKDQNEDHLATLELEYELQSKITSAAHSLAHDKSVSKYVRKQRRQAYSRASTKLKEMEKKLTEARRKSSRTRTRDDRQENNQAVSGESKYGDHDIIGGDHHRHYVQDKHHQHTQSMLPASPSQQSRLLSPSHGSPHLPPGYLQNTGFDSRVQYHPHYPAMSSSSSRNTLSPSSSLSPASTRSIQDDLSTGSSSVNSSSNNLYNLGLQQTSKYESYDLLKSPSSSITDSYGEATEQQLQLPSKHGSLDRAYKRGDHSYGSLDRKKRQHGYSVEPRDTGRDHVVGSGSLFLDVKSGYHQQQGDLKCSSQSPSKVELPVYHEKSHHGPENSYWKGNTYHDAVPSSLARSPETMCANWGVSGNTFESYSPRLSETAQQARLSRDITLQQKQMQQLHLSHHFHQHSHSQPQDAVVSPYGGKYEPVPVLHLESRQHPMSPSQSQPQSPSSPPPAPSTLVTVTRFQPHMEVTKPYEISDFFKYSERLRKQRIIENYQRQLMGATNLDRSSGASTPSHSSDSDSHSLYSSHSGSSLSHAQRLAATSTAFFASPSKGGSLVYSHPASPQFHKHEPDQGSYIPADQTQTPLAAREQPPYIGYSARDVVTSSSLSEFQTVRSQGPSLHFATGQTHSSYRDQHVHTAASAKHLHYQPPTPMTCQPVRDQTVFKGGGPGK
ncbi:FERM domain-containing protein 4A-like isoform X3 [Pomacea canaliculata]|nr:FERM domain-containing protein 4A-like isoform X3 [Pomacea canaliculata]